MIDGFTAWECNACAFPNGPMAIKEGAIWNTDGGEGLPDDVRAGLGGDALRHSWLKKNKSTPKYVELREVGMVRSWMDAFAVANENPEAANEPVEVLAQRGRRLLKKLLKEPDLLYKAEEVRQALAVYDATKDEGSDDWRESIPKEVGPGANDWRASLKDDDDRSQD